MIRSALLRVEAIEGLGRDLGSGLIVLALAILCGLRRVARGPDLGQISHRARQGGIRRRLTATTLGIEITEFACLSSVEASAVRPVQLQAHWRVWQ